MPTTRSSHPDNGSVGLWWIVAVVAGGLIMVMTAPGQTTGLSVFTDPLLAELSIDRTALSLSYLFGTLAGAAAQPFIGRASDRWDVRHVIAVIAVVFAVVLLALSLVTGLVGLTFGYVGVRMAGQGALGLAVTTALSRGIRHRRGLALGISSAIGSAGISLAPVLLERVVSAVGIRAAWRWEALAVLLVVVPLAYLMPPRNLDPLPSGNTAARIADRWTQREALRTGMFWVLSAAVATVAMLGTALGFHQIALLGERGLTPFEAAANFLPQTVTALVATLLVGGLVDRVDPRVFVVISMGLTGAALAMVPVIGPGWSAITYGLILGAAGGALRGMEAATFARYFGVANIGAIRGVATSIGLAASALGPIALSVGVDRTGTFTTPALMLAVIPAVVAVAALVARPPRHPSTR
ncbi:MAG TPA: MFS transporter [Arachnia sp.]|nr:MFS transporter [Arachnia sp.]